MTYYVEHSSMPANVVIREAPAEVVEQARKILESHHEHLLEARILFLFSNAKSSSRGHVLLGKSKKLTPEQRYLSSGVRGRTAPGIGEVSVEAGYDFAVVVSQTQWSSLLATQREALLDHLLCFCDRKERINRRTGSVSYSWAIRGPDVEEFSEVVQRHGLWRPQIQKFVQSADVTKQLPLPPDAVIDVKVPVERKTTVDGSGVVVHTEVEGGEGLVDGKVPEPFNSMPAVRLEEGLPVVPAGDAEASGAPSTSPSEAPVCAWVGCEKLRKPGSSYCEDYYEHEGHFPREAMCAWPGCNKPRVGNAYCEDEAKHANGETVAELFESHEDRSREQQIEDLDRRDEELERKQAEASIPGSWREVTGVGKTARRRS